MNTFLEHYAFIVIFPVLFLSVAIHEFAHCWMTDRLGDDTPRLSGRLTLNPLAHLDPLGTVMMVVTSFLGFGFGWGKPARFNPANFQHPARDRMLTAIAGPISNLLQMLGWASLYLLAMPLLQLAHPAPDAFVICYAVCKYGMTINALLACFNLLPVYPLDGHHILSFLAPPAMRPIIDNPLWGLVFLFVVFSGAFSHLVTPLMQLAEQSTHYLIGWPLGWPPL